MYPTISITFNTLLINNPKTSIPIRKEFFKLLLFLIFSITHKSQ